MKKLFIVLAVASIGLASCGNSGDSTKASDTPAPKVDTPAVKATPDTLPKVDTTPKKDTTAKKDTTSKMKTKKK